MSLDPSTPGRSPSRAPSVNRFRRLLAAPSRRPLVIAHRGDSARAPENTLEAAELAWKAGADAWEFDVQLTRDGAPILIHDESLLRTTDVASRFAGDPRSDYGFLVSHFALDEIRRLDAGSWFISSEGGPRSARAFGTLDTLDPVEHARFASGEVGIPTLVEALELTARLDWLANVEVKSFPNTDPRLLDAVLATIEQTGTASRVLVSSFDHADVARTAREQPDIATGVLVSTPLHDPAAYVRDVIGADAYHPSHLVLGAGSDRYLRHRNAAYLRSGDLAALEAAGIPVLVYTVNDASAEGLAAHLARAGVRALFTDTPRIIRQLLAQIPAEI